MIVGFTGHRKLGGYKVPNPTYTYVEEQIKKTLAEKFKKVDSILSGMAIGSDFLAAKIAIKLEIPFTAVVPFRGKNLGGHRLFKKNIEIYCQKQKM